MSSGSNVFFEPLGIFLAAYSPLTCVRSVISHPSRLAIRSHVRSSAGVLHVRMNPFGPLATIRQFDNSAISFSRSTIIFRSLAFRVAPVRDMRPVMLE